MKKINLKANHRRSVSSSIRLVENMGEELEIEIIKSRERFLTKINRGDY